MPEKGFHSVRLPKMTQRECITLNRSKEYCFEIETRRDAAAPPVRAVIFLARFLSVIVSTYIVRANIFNSIQIHFDIQIRSNLPKL